MATMIPAAANLTDLLTDGSHTALGAFLPAGFPNFTAGIETLRAFTRHGADFLEVGVPVHEPTLDGPDITQAYAQALGQGAGMAHALSTIRLAVSITGVPVVAMTYWTPVLEFGIRRFAQNLARVGAAGAMIPDLPLSEAGGWIATAREAGIHTPQFAPRSADDEELSRITDAASGWVYAPAASAPTGFQGELDLKALGDFTARLRSATSLPVVGGIGISTPERAVAVAPYVDAVVIGSPLVRPLLQAHGALGLETAALQLQAFADALNPPGATRALSA
ncbi:tryptophan synthase subunit alpha [Streptomyces nigrescens]|uniref:tryptophan synthase subunit alpha n=1 Tax=Streptomyces nigrescens TaxID=1920 RepID=UPI0036FA08D8